MKVLVLNAGSSSVKFKLFSIEKWTVLASGIAESIFEPISTVSFASDKEQYRYQEKIDNHTEAITLLVKMLVSHQVVSSLREIAAVGHRVVHGGNLFYEPTLISQEVISQIESLEPLAPLHNHANLEGIRAMQALIGDLPQVAVFDTAFHHTVPPYAYRYALPNFFYDNLGVRRYGFHGTSHHYVAKQTAEAMGKKLETLNIISLHLGNGASACAIREGRSIDTSMGMTPLEGLVMGSRSGDIDPGIIFYLLRHTQLNADEIEKMLNTQSGLKGIVQTNDMRQIEEKIAHEDPLAILAMEIFVYRIVKYIGAYAAILGRLDALVFTGGIGEHSAKTREAVCAKLTLFGAQMDMHLNTQIQNGCRSIHASESKIEIWITPTDEECAIAKETVQVTGRKSKKNQI
ncbi:MAG TPA: acetate kinase [Sulfurovum sp. UBA12169]|nr:MAG TPA: acetate kinase [Sulfurovum sp. UBA12169]